MFVNMDSAAGCRTARSMAIAATLIVTAGLASLGAGPAFGQGGFRHRRADASAYAPPARVYGPPRQQQYAPPPASAYASSAGRAPAAAQAAPRLALLSRRQMDRLIGPVALYPDPLLAQILPAATYPHMVVAADQWLQNHPQAPAAVIDAQPWPRAVIALSHYPGVLNMMAQDPQWTRAVGAAFLNQPGGVTISIQRLRADALAAGALRRTRQLRVIRRNGFIYILPANPQRIYVPIYNPNGVYVRARRFGRPPIRFGAGLPVGGWLNLDFDWRTHHLDERRWDARGWRRPLDHDGGDHREWVRSPQEPLRRGNFATGRLLHADGGGLHEHFLAVPSTLGGYRDRRNTFRGRAWGFHGVGQRDGERFDRRRERDHFRDGRGEHQDHARGSRDWRRQRDGRDRGADHRDHGGDWHGRGDHNHHRGGDGGDHHDRGGRHGGGDH